MIYPKPVMRKSELQEMGFPEQYLFDAYNFTGQRFAWKMNPTKPNSCIVFDTEEFDKWRQKQIKMQIG